MSQFQRHALCLYKNETHWIFFHEEKLYSIYSICSCSTLGDLQPSVSPRFPLVLCLCSSLTGYLTKGSSAFHRRPDYFAGSSKQPASPANLRALEFRFACRTDNRKYFFRQHVINIMELTTSRCEDGFKKEIENMHQGWFFINTYLIALTAKSVCRRMRATECLCLEAIYNSTWVVKTNHGGFFLSDSV